MRRLCWCLLFVLAQPAQATLFDHLLESDSTSVWVLDSSFDPTGFLGPLDPPWLAGANRLVRLDLDGGLHVGDDLSLAGPGPILSFALSPDGNSAVAGRIGNNELVFVRDLRSGSPYVSSTLAVARQPLALSYSPDGRVLLVGTQLNSAGESTVTRVRGLPDRPFIDGTYGLGVEAQALSAVESLSWSPDGSVVVAQIGAHQTYDLPAFFLADTYLVSLSGMLSSGPVVPSEPLLLPAVSAIPPAPPFEGLETGRAFGDSVVLCDGDSVAVPVPGALDIGQPDARIFLVRGAASGELQIERVLGPQDGVGAGPDHSRA